MCSRKSVAICELATTLDAALGKETENEIAEMHTAEQIRYPVPPQGDVPHRAAPGYVALPRLRGAGDRRDRHNVLYQVRLGRVHSRCGVDDLTIQLKAKTDHPRGESGRGET